MRAAILHNIRELGVRGFTVSTELPWDTSGTPLYQRNKRTVYASEPNVVDSIQLNTICGSNRVIARESTVTVYLAVDAKQKPTGYDQLVSGILDLQSQFRNFFSVDISLTNTLESDTLLAEFEFRIVELRK